MKLNALISICWVSLFFPLAMLYYQILGDSEVAQLQRFALNGAYLIWLSKKAGNVGEIFQSDRAGLYFTHEPKQSSLARLSSL